MLDTKLCAKKHVWPKLPDVTYLPDYKDLTSEKRKNPRIIFTRRCKRCNFFQSSRKWKIDELFEKQYAFKKISKAKFDLSLVSTPFKYKKPLPEFRKPLVTQRPKYL